MKWQLICIIGSLAAQSCHSQKINLKQRLLTEPFVLLQAKKVWPPYYIKLQHDTAYFETIVKDKGIRFFGFDTLILAKDSSCYKGNGKTLFFNEDALQLEIDGASNRRIDFVVANKKKIAQWDTYKNTSKYNLTISAVEKLLEANKANPSQYHEISREWDNLLKQVSKLGQEQFDLTLSRFKAKHGLGNS